MMSFFPSILGSLRFGLTDLAAIQRLGEARGRQLLYVRQVPEQLEALVQRAQVESTESSNRIEGIVASRERIAALVHHDSEPRSRSEQEIAGYKSALALIHDSHAAMPLTPNVILQLHSMLYRHVGGDGGRYKSMDNEIVERDADGRLLRVRFAPVSALQTPQAMRDLCDGYRLAGQEGYEPLVLAPLAVLDFLCIHPFRDGNGRISRLLTTLLLYHARYEVGRYISLERLVEESKDGYYDALERSSVGWHQGAHDVLPWLRYVWGILQRACGEFEARIQLIQSGRGSKTRQVLDAIERRLGPFVLKDIADDCPGISQEQVRAVLRELRDKGQIAHVGQGRGARWHKTGAP